MKPWDRQVREPLKAFEIFTEFRDGDSNRNIEIIQLSHPELNGEIIRFEKKWKWHERVLEYDEFISSNNSEIVEVDSQLITGLDLLLNVIEAKLNSEDEIVGMKIDVLIKLLSIYSKAIPDILNMKKILNGKSENNAIPEVLFLSESIRQNNDVLEKISDLLTSIEVNT